MRDYNEWNEISVSLLCVLVQILYPIMEICTNPGCTQLGTNQCSACKTTPYCGPICQTADWAHHKEECPGHLRKIGMAHLEKAKGFHRDRNWPQTLRHADLAATKLKLLIKDRPVEIIDEALGRKYDALSFMGRHREALECAKEWYCLWPTKHTHPPAIQASFCLIESCIFNNEFFDAALYARTLWETITLSQDSHIPEHLLQNFTARAAFELARATSALAQTGGIRTQDMQEAGVEATMLARKALEINTKLYGIESCEVAENLGILAIIIDYFNGVDDDEVLRLYQQMKAIFVRKEGTLSRNVAAAEANLGTSYCNRAKRALDAHDLNRQVANLELALPHFRESARIFRAINHMEKANQYDEKVVNAEKLLLYATERRAAATRD